MALPITVPHSCCSRPRATALTKCCTASRASQAPALRPSVLLGGEVRRALPQDVLLDLPGRGLRQLADEGDPARGLEVSQVIPREGDDLCLGRARVLVQHHERVWRLA